jgi:hypothetical protein
LCELAEAVALQKDVEFYGEIRSAIKKHSDEVETSHTVASVVALLVTAGIYFPLRIDVTSLLIPRVSQAPAH